MLQICECIEDGHLPNCGSRDDDCNFAGRSKMVTREDGLIFCRSCGWQCEECNGTGIVETASLSGEVDRTVEFIKGSVMFVTGMAALGTLFYLVYNSPLQ